jgi:hypothetical protein
MLRAAKCVAIIAIASSGAFPIIVAKSGGDYTTIKAGLTAAQAGDTVYVKAGTYQETVTFGKSGTIAAPIVLCNYGTDTPVIDGNATSGNVVTIADKSNVQIIGFEVQNAKGGDPSIGISIEGCGENIVIKNCKVHDITSANKNAHGIAAYGSDGANPITNLLVEGNEIYNCKLGQSESMVLNGNVTRFQVINNTVHDNDNIGIDFIGYEGTAGSNDQAREGVCVGNHVYNISSTTNPTYGGDGCADGIYVDGGRDIVIERNIVDKCDIGIEVASEHGGKSTSNITVRSNWVSNSAQANILTGGYASGKGSATNIVIVNNTLYHGSDGEIGLQFNNNGVVIKNNICVARSGKEYISDWGSNNTNVTLDNNLYFGASSSSPGSWNDAHAIYADPKLINAPTDMRVPSNSPAVDVGVSLTAELVGELDIDGNNRVNGTDIDIGAFEFQNGTAVVRRIVRSNERVVMKVIGPSQLSLSAVSGATVELLDLAGRVMRTWHPQSAQLCISTSGIAHGQYLVRIANHDGVQILKTVVVR